MIKLIIWLLRRYKKWIHIVTVDKVGRTTTRVWFKINEPEVELYIKGEKI